MRIELHEHGVDKVNVSDDDRATVNGDHGNDLDLNCDMIENRDYYGYDLYHNFCRYNNCLYHDYDNHDRVRSCDGYDCKTSFHHRNDIDLSHDNDVYYHFY